MRNLVQQATPRNYCGAPTDERHRRTIPSYAVRRISARFGIPCCTAAEIARAAGFPQFIGEGR